MTIELSKDARKEAVSSIEKFLAENCDDLGGNIGATQLLNFFLIEVAPAVYNKAVSDVQHRLQARIADIESEVFEDEFQYWQIQARQKARK
jgi:uncharacterized protein (DUF2164 family)